MDARLAKLRRLGYTVERAQKGGTRYVDPATGAELPRDDGGEPLELPDTWSVSGFGITTHVREDDDEALHALADDATHRERVFQVEHPAVSYAVAHLRSLGFEVETPDAHAQRVIVRGADGQVSIRFDELGTGDVAPVEDASPPARPPVADVRAALGL